MQIQHKTPAPQRREQINTQRTATVEAGFLFNGRVFQSDTASREAIASKVQTLLVRERLNLPLPAQIQWWDIENQPQLFTVEAFYHFALELGEWALGVVEQARKEKDGL